MNTLSGILELPNGTEGRIRQLDGCLIETGSVYHPPMAALAYRFSFDGDQAHCREGYSDAAGILAHLENVGALLEEALAIADITRLEVHGPEDELAQLREPLAALSPQFFTLEFGFRR